MYFLDMTGSNVLYMAAVVHGEKEAASLRISLCVQALLKKQTRADVSSYGREEYYAIAWNN